MNRSILTREIKNYICSEREMDLVGICPASALEQEPEGHRPRDILKCAKSVIVFGKRLLNGAVQAAFRRLEDGNESAESIYATFGADLVPDFTMLFDTFYIANYLENTFGVSVQPLSCGPNQNGVAYNTPLPLFAGPYQGGIPFQISHAAVAAGLAQPAWSNYVVTAEFGPRVRFGAILTDLELDYDGPDHGPRLCNPEKCHVCSEQCPMHALPEKGMEESKVWQIAGDTYEVSAHRINACTVAALGLRDEFAGRNKPGDLVESDQPSDEEIGAALKKKPFSRTNLDHYPKYFCNRCMLYCPIGDWDEIFSQKQLTKYRQTTQ